MRKLYIISAFSLFKISSSFLRYDYQGINNPPFFNYYFLKELALAFVQHLIISQKNYKFNAIYHSNFNALTGF